MQEIFQALACAGASPFIVGGAARDAVLSHQTPKDFDIEVFGIDANTLISVLRQFGRVDAVGASFGVIKLTTPSGGDFDFSLPRRENKSGRGHRGFIVTPDPTMTPREAASRRDFTVNALMVNALTGEVLDFFGGAEDWAQGVLRHVGPAFAEDPLRVLRAMQFAARWGFTLAPETAELCQSLVGEFTTLPRERIWGEWEKLAVKGTRPSAGLRALQAAGWAGCFAGLRTDERVFEDCDRAARVADAHGLRGEDRAVLILASIASSAQFPIAIGAPRPVARRISALVEQVGQQETNVRRIAYKLSEGGETVRMLSRLVSILFSDLEAEMLLASAERTGVVDGPPSPVLLGRHLIERGWAPGPRIGQLVRNAFEAQLEGAFSDLEGALRWLEN